nr:MAG TPA: hypothetical protein [Caudoviricetes sp.]
MVIKSGQSTALFFLPHLYPVILNLQFTLHL